MRKMWPTVDRSLFLTCWYEDLISVLIRFCYNLFFSQFLTEILSWAELTFSPGSFFEEVRKFYSPDAVEGDRMFMKAITGSKFDVWDVRNQVLFSTKQPLGKNMVWRVI